MRQYAKKPSSNTWRMSYSSHAITEDRLHVFTGKDKGFANLMLIFSLCVLECHYSCISKCHSAVPWWLCDFFLEAFVSTLALETFTVNWLLPCAACLTVTVTLTCYWKTVFTVPTVKALVSPSGWVCFTLINNKMCVWICVMDFCLQRLAFCTVKSDRTSWLQLFFLLNRSCDSLNIRVSEMWISFSVSHFNGLKHHLIISSETSEVKC